MESVQVRRDRHSREEEEPESPYHYLSLVHPPPPPCSSSAHWTPQQMEFPDTNRSSVGSGNIGGAEKQQPLQAPFVEKEHMFDKVVTPSDVGKLNRLVIPKQHAERYFPLDSTNDKGMLLNFEDRTGKPWRFRYSYWNSSQSYVMTKGWSRFVKEKRLDAGDTVSFGRGVGEAARDRLFIDWKRRIDAAHDPPRLLRLPIAGYHHHDPSSIMSFSRSVVPWSNLAVPPPTSAISALKVYDYSRQAGYGYNAAAAAATSNPYLYLRSAGSTSQVGVQLGVGSGYGGGGDGGLTGLGVPMVFDSVTMGRGNATPKRVRLFGVNLDTSPSKAGTEEDAVAVESPRLPLLPPAQFRLGSSETVESPRKGKQPMSLDLEM
ncbi:unnamed protein product [Spirodela intermedia]|uniref:TF-B3 domain-containing protein n=1 Tax=Spirodela intermedia TaxID=51605 RepID=A0A7I8K3X8_SPIIN|nr:unnamed protein product [Spirodela intermedia]